MSLVAMAKPHVRDACDAVVFALHAYMQRNMFSCVGLEEQGDNKGNRIVCVHACVCVRVRV